MELSEVISRIKDHIKVHFENEKRHHPPIKITKALNIAVDLLEKQLWHYPSKGELPNEAEIKDCEIIANILIYTKSKQLRTGFYHRGEFCICNGANLPPDLVIAWKYLPEPPKENV